jgi:hypothetical protein
MDKVVVQKIQEYLQNMDDFLIEKAPEVVRQALRYEKMSTWAHFVAVSLIIGALLWIVYCCWMYPKLDKYGSRETECVLGMFIPWAVLPLLLIDSWYCIDRLIKIYTAPKYFLLQLTDSLG